LLALLLAPAGCSWFSTECVVDAELPELPEHWKAAFPELRFELQIAREDGEPQRIPWPSGGRLNIPKRPNEAALAVPVVRDGRYRLPPAGAVWPMDLEDDGRTLAFHWQRGPLAQVLMALSRQGFQPSRLNTIRLDAEMQERSRGDPWSLDLVHLAERLVSGAFRVTDIKALPTRDIGLEVPPGAWFLESPFRSPQPASEGGGLVLSGVPLGAHRLFGADGSKTYALYVGEREALIAGE